MARSVLKSANLTLRAALNFIDEEEGRVPSVQWDLYYLRGTHLVGASLLGDLKDEAAGFHFRHIPHKMSLIVMGMLLRHSI